MCKKNNYNTIKYTFKRGDKPELEVEFNPKNKLKRWVDLGTYSTYLGFNKGQYSYVLIVPEERSNVVALLEFSKNGERISTKRCDSNSFGKKDIKSNSIEDMPDATIIDNGFTFP
ncbi:hypothetical protein SJI19_23140 [Acerihabitans sp. TG2]|uniref:hypothetical protein n=1 Tax=Acerihabitans sp. TG2 TaxID=3096008 RepID=UPI002B23A7A3|nr:hypothetical protein [Acerihabitans sp. TG2]MEA9393394.1 hypothetical protein [Acerihabitans sp. TG2]